MLPGISRRVFLAGAGAGRRPPGRSGEGNVVVFETGEHDVRMTIEYYDSYTGQGFWFKDRNSGARVCFSAAGDQNKDCLEGFVGSLAVVEYKVRRRSGSTREGTLREYVRTIDQDDALPKRPDVDRAIALTDGIASDVQAFGYETGGSETRRVSPAETGGPWCYVRQDLYLGTRSAPFVVLHWKHELTMIRLIDAIARSGTAVKRR